MTFVSGQNLANPNVRTLRPNYSKQKVTGGINRPALGKEQYEASANLPPEVQAARDAGATVTRNDKEYIVTGTTLNSQDQEIQQPNYIPVDSLIDNRNKFLNQVNEPMSVFRPDQQKSYAAKTRTVSVSRNISPQQQSPIIESAKVTQQDKINYDPFNFVGQIKTGNQSQTNFVRDIITAPSPKQKFTTADYQRQQAYQNVKNQFEANPLQYEGSEYFKTSTLTTAAGTTTSYSLSQDYFNSKEFRDTLYKELPKEKITFGEFLKTPFLSPQGLGLVTTGLVGEANIITGDLVSNIPSGYKFNLAKFIINPVTELTRGSPQLLKTKTPFTVQQGGDLLLMAAFSPPVPGAGYNLLSTTASRGVTIGGSPFVKYSVTPTYLKQVGADVVNVPFDTASSFSISQVKVGGLTPEYTFGRGESILGANVNILNEKEFTVQVGGGENIAPIRLRSGDLTIKGTAWGYGTFENGVGKVAGWNFIVEKTGIQTKGFTSVYGKIGDYYAKTPIEGTDAYVLSDKGLGFIDKTFTAGETKLSFSGITPTSIKDVYRFQSSDTIPSLRISGLNYGEPTGELLIKFNYPKISGDKGFTIIKGGGSKTPLSYTFGETQSQSQALTTQFKDVSIGPAIKGLETSATETITTTTKFNLYPASAFAGTGQYERTEGLTATKTIGSGLSLKNEFTNNLNPMFKFQTPSLQNRKSYLTFTSLYPVQSSSNLFKQSLYTPSLQKVEQSYTFVTPQLTQQVFGTSTTPPVFYIPPLDITGFGGAAGIPFLGFDNAGFGRSKTKKSKPQRISPSLLGIANRDLLGITGTKPFKDISIGGINPFKTRLVLTGMGKGTRKSGKKRKK
jgi:hypothetical protein